MRAIAPFAALALIGCAPMDSEPPVVGAGACNAEKAQGFVGQPGTSETAARARDAAGASMVRWLRPGMAVTMEYRADRLNIEVDDKDVIVSIRCG